jgi:hypothetical protein
MVSGWMLLLFKTLQPLLWTQAVGVFIHRVSTLVASCREWKWGMVYSHSCCIVIKSLCSYLNARISKFGVGSKQAAFYIGDALTVITKMAKSNMACEFTLSVSELAAKYRNREGLSNTISSRLFSTY